MSDEIFIQLKDFTENKCGVDISSKNNRLYEDLGVYGDDAIEYLIAFGKKFNVDVSKFMAADYFKPEGFDILGLYDGKVYKPLTLGQLEKAILTGKLNDDVING